MKWVNSIFAFFLSAAILQCNGKCEDDSECDDGIFCNGQERCFKGKCSSTLQFPCNDDIPCTIDSCDEESRQCTNEAPDLDEDGYPMEGCSGGDDCNDYNPDIHPGAGEQCNGLDDDCDGTIGEDKDRDRHFDPAVCEEGDDCDDENHAIYPGAPEICDGLDNNCVNGTSDEQDTDLDGYIDVTCSGGDDCDDENESVNPGAAEVCNGEDDDCDEDCDEDFDCCLAAIDECTTSCGSTGTWICTAGCSWSECEPPEEMCNGVDDDCDGDIDEDLPCSPGELFDCETICFTTGQGFCTDLCQPAAPEDCMPPEEICNDLDDDCDGEIDETSICVPGEVVPCITICNSMGLGYCTDTCEIPTAEECEPPEETCFNYKDDDCDGDIDEFCYG